MRVIFATLAALWTVNFLGMAVSTNMVAGPAYVKIALPAVLLSVAVGAAVGWERRYDFGKLRRSRTREGRGIETESVGAEEAAIADGQRKGKASDESQDS